MNQFVYILPHFLNYSSSRIRYHSYVKRKYGICYIIVSAGILIVFQYPENWRSFSLNPHAHNPFYENQSKLPDLVMFYILLPIIMTDPSDQISHLWLPVEPTDPDTPWTASTTDAAAEVPPVFARGSPCADPGVFAPMAADLSTMLQYCSFTDAVFGLLLSALFTRPNSFVAPAAPFVSRQRLLHWLTNWHWFNFKMATVLDRSFLLFC